MSLSAGRLGSAPVADKWVDPEVVFTNDFCEPECGEMPFLAAGGARSSAPECAAGMHGLRQNCTETKGADECTAPPCTQPGPCALCEACGQRANSPTPLPW